MVSFYFFSTFKLQQIIYMPRPPLRPQAARVCWRGRERGGGHPPPQKNSPKIFFRQKLPRRGHLGHGPPGGAEGGGRGGHPLKLKISQKNFTNFFYTFFFAKNFPEGTTAAARRQGVLKWGRKGGVHLQKNTGHKAQHNNLVYRPT